MPRRLTHGTNADCPQVRAGAWPRCLGHDIDRRDVRLRDVQRLLAYAVEYRDWSAVREARDRLESARLAALQEG